MISKKDFTEKFNDPVPNIKKPLLLWAVLFFFMLIVVWFLHESAHGFGFMLEDVHVSTGFNLVGSSGKGPGDLDFALDLPVKGLTLGLLFGPLSNWILGIVFTAILLRRKKADRTSLWIGAVSISNAIMRLLPMGIFFIAAALGSISGVTQDEQKMSLSAIESIELPITETEFKSLLANEPSVFLNDPGFYFWTLMSIGISTIILVLTYRHLFNLFHLDLKQRWKKIGLGLIPLLLYFPVFGIVSLLDSLIRINW